MALATYDTFVLTDPTAAFTRFPDMAAAFKNGRQRQGVGTASIAFDMAPVTRQDEQERAQLAQWGYTATVMVLKDTQVARYLVGYGVMSDLDWAQLPVEKQSRYNALLFHCSRLTFCHYGEYGTPTSRWFIVPPSAPLTAPQQMAVTRPRGNR